MIRQVAERENVGSKPDRIDARALVGGGWRRYADLLGNRGIRPTAVIALAAFVALVAWLVIDSTGGGSDNASKPEESEAVALDLGGLKKMAKSSPQPIYWVGSQRGKTYELRKASNGVFLRYLPAGVEAGDPRGLLTIGTYPLQNAYAVTKTRSGTATVTRDIAGGGVAAYNKSRPSSVYVAYPGSEVQIEVYDPRPDVARRFATSGRVRPVIESAATLARGPVATTRRKLKSLATSLGHPIYWAGERPNTTLELWQTAKGYTFVRYLRKGVPVGSGRKSLIVATYPMTNAYEITRDSTAKSKDGVTINLPDGGIAAYTRRHRTNVYVAYPGVDVQVEVFDPIARVTPKLVASGQIVPVR